MTIKTDVAYKVTQEAKQGKLELGTLILKNVPLVYAKVQEPVQQLGADTKQYEADVFIDEATLQKMYDINVNKGFSQVGVDKKTKGANRGKLKYDPAQEAFAPYDKMYGFKLTQKEFSKAGKKQFVKVIKDGKPFQELLGNGTTANIKCFGYRNRDGELNISMQVVAVLDHVPYEQGEVGGSYFDEDLGMSIPSDDEFGFSDAESAPFEADKPKKADVPDDLFEEEDPFAEE